MMIMIMIMVMMVIKVNVSDDMCRARNSKNKSERKTSE
jgi:hypothetical protein